ncbi:gliding motility-associated C-terminal domain-containing protein [Mesonia sp. K7]|uniref:gliding motility-associated C-terminal domain-containing protein n=1 Tax=Mesonia sp. K7 TaxID=2218606 RepID=UPI000DA9D9B4|nr:gliding motility-associated C-terminal domain-containing protein [Mesonia sp. K7]PZD78253.1 hypothetical protein DNG35_06020 [Mesonia sp. K7]
MKLNTSITVLFFVVNFYWVSAQNITQFTQFNGNYDYTAIGATLNQDENNLTSTCVINTGATATLNLLPTQTIEAAYLYWAGSGNGDYTVKLNNVDIVVNKTFLYDFVSNDGNTYHFFAAFSDITSQVQTTGNGNYTLTDLDLNAAIQPNCSNRTNFGGWSIIVVYEDLTLPLNQISIYDGLQGVNVSNNNLQIVLNNLNVIDNEGAKIGFLAWEGDENLAVNETLRLNGNILSNTLNPANNAFNGTNSFTNDIDFYNMDLDVYDVENYINIGDNSATIELTSGQDFIMINNVVTVFNSTLPDPAVTIGNVSNNCNDREITVDYTIDNYNGTEDLPAGILVRILADNQLVFQTNTPNIIPIGADENFTQTINLPSNIPVSFNLEIQVNLNAAGNTIINEINPANDTDQQTTDLTFAEIASPPLDLKLCDDVSNDGEELFDLTQNTPIVTGGQPHVVVNYFLDQNQANQNIGAITNNTNYPNISNPQEIFVRVTSSFDDTCFVTDSFFIEVFETPDPSLPQDLILCDKNELDGISTFDLTENTPLLENQVNNIVVSYYNSLTDAQNFTNPISNSQNYQNSALSETIYANIYNQNHPECQTVVSFQIEVIPIDITEIDGKLKCDAGFDANEFDLYEIANQLTLSPTEVIDGFYLSANDANAQFNAVFSPSFYTNTTNPQEIFFSISDTSTNECKEIYHFTISTEHCEPFIPQGFSPNNDGINDTFLITGLYDIFEDFHLKIYTRYGNLIYEGGNQTEPWDGTSNRGLNNVGKQLPTGTYFYVLNLKDPVFGPYKSWVYLNR